MHTRYPSFSFTNISMFAAANAELPAPETAVFYQGSTLILDMMLFLGDKPLTPDEYDILFVLKKSTDAQNVLRKEEIKEKVPDRPDGFYRITLPASFTAKLKPGVYYYAVQATQKATGGVLLPYRGTFSLELSAASPNPNLGITDGEPIADGPLGTSDEMTSPAEITGPDTPDIGRQF